MVKDAEYCLEEEKRIIRSFLDGHKNRLSSTLVTRFVLDNITYRLDSFPDDAEVRESKNAEKYLMDLAKKQLYGKKEQLGEKDDWERYLQVMMLKAIDESWIEEVDYLQQLKQAVVGRRYTQRNIAFEYHEDAYKAYERMQKKIRVKMLRNIMLGDVQWTADKELQVVLP